MLSWRNEHQSFNNDWDVSQIASHRYVHVHFFGQIGLERCRILARLKFGFSQTR